MSHPRDTWPVVAVSAAGVVFILLGLMALALPTAQEGVQILMLDSQHAIYLMDVAGGFAIGLGVVLTWLGSRVWHHILRG
jgi:hypothetical protein